MDKLPFKLHISDSFRATGLDPVKTGTTMSLLLLWSQTAALKLKELPALRDASAEFVLKNLEKVVKTLCPEWATEISRLLGGQRAGDVDIMRRTIISALDAQLTAEEIAEAILESCAPNAWIAAEHANIVLATLDAKKGTRIRCGFYYALGTAWTLSKQSSVELDVDSDDFVPVLSILSLACGHSLQARACSIGSVTNGSDQLGDVDHALIVPPIGMRLKLDHPSAYPRGVTGDQMSSEAFAALWGAHLGRKRNVVIVGNGLLFRTSSKEAAFKQELIQHHGLEAVISLPRGMFPGTSIAMSALVFSGQSGAKSRKDGLRFIDTSDPRTLDQATLSKLLAGKTEHPLCVDASIQEIVDAGFNLSVDRYVLDAETRRNRELLDSRETVRLSDIADIRRPQALPREAGKEKGFEVREALLADIDNGRLSVPTKLSELPQSAAPKVESAILKPGDILLSIKGTIGKIALVTDDAIAKSGSIPIIPGQSFVIIRLRKGSVIRDPEVLAGYLRSPLAQSLLQGMAGGTTIANVAMGELKDMPVPALPLGDQQSILEKYNEWQDLQYSIDKLREKMKYTEQQIFSIALGGK